MDAYFQFLVNLKWTIINLPIPVAARSEFVTNFFLPPPPIRGMKIVLRYVTSCSLVEPYRRSSKSL